jgi:hypothetical protein
MGRMGSGLEFCVKPVDDLTRRADASIAADARHITVFRHDEFGAAPPRQRSCRWDRSWRISAGPRAGQKVFTLQTVAARDEGEGRNGAAQAGGFSLHAGVSIRAG